MLQYIHVVHFDKPLVSSQSTGVSAEEELAPSWHGRKIIIGT